MKIEDRVYELFINAEKTKVKESEEFGLTTKFISEELGLIRTNVSAILNKLWREDKIKKINGRPVKYIISNENDDEVLYELTFKTLIGKDDSLKESIDMAKAAIRYPPMGLHTLILGPTGVGKTMFAELMYKYAIDKNMLKVDSPFITFNCADYANNPQLLLSQLFGYAKGAFTGADKSSSGMVQKANGGILFLDEIHRLPPEGQELLFYLIDKGEYSSLGESTRKKAEVLIICATTESKDSSLLNTFTRRIPMTINIPSIDKRTIAERFNLISNYFKEEAKRINSNISVKNEVIKSLICYECTGNIGQLKSDIRLICANAFLNYISKKNKFLEVELNHVPSYVKLGMLKTKEYGEEIDEVISGDKEIVFSNKGMSRAKSFKDYGFKFNLYARLETRRKELRDKGYVEDDIKMILDFEIDKYFNKYINTLDTHNIEISKMIDKAIINNVERFLYFASKKLNCTFSNQIFYGLCFHTHATIRRLKECKEITNYNLINIIENNKVEFELARNFCKELEREYKVSISIDEVGFMTMFICADKALNAQDEKRPLAVIAMHGKSTATSMSEVVNTLLGINYVLAYDMNLEKKSQQCYEELEKLIVDNNEGVGVILMVDMGSLEMFGDLISEKTGIKIRVCSLVTTVMALEVARYVEFESNIDKICEDIGRKIPLLMTYGRQAVDNVNEDEMKVLITICTTGEGSALKIKNIIEDKINLSSKGVKIIPVAINGKEELDKRIVKIGASNKIIGAVGTIDPHIHGIPFISLGDLIMFNRYDDIVALIDKDDESDVEGIASEFLDIYNQVFEALKGKVENYNIDNIKGSMNRFIRAITKDFTSLKDKDIFVGLIFHIISAIDTIIDNKKRPVFKKKEEILIAYHKDVRVIKDGLSEIESKYNIVFDEDEICYIISILRTA